MDSNRIPHHLDSLDFRHRVNVFVSKLGPTGQTLLYSTYLGGSEWDHSGGIALDTTGNIYITGMTQSTNFPVFGALQSAKKGVRDVFLTKFTPTGQSYRLALNGQFL
ncbi:MAG: SBBP repeat-containing protein [Proteobacteria bacterium]|nr:SBBP repeat-containing protein [Pseudomonadota bacterium]MBU4356732.1 SBBP repeat-containing protein [Pseudomonadota bacterium]MBU4448300.1 SBBP repeat-containing protein [Pseudomonadota bacterium]MCG2773537.1 SBBP repeat-containing protein [Desulfobacterales bacterium]